MFAFCIFSLQSPTLNLRALERSYTSAYLTYCVIMSQNNIIMGEENIIQGRVQHLYLFFVGVRKTVADKRHNN